jgi:hypothetical protein
MDIFLERENIILILTRMRVRENGVLYRKHGH